MTRSERLNRITQMFTRYAESEKEMIKYGLSDEPDYQFLVDILLDEQKRSEGCAYEQIDDDQNIWKCDKCGEEWCFTEGGVIENNTDYCPKCGLPILRVITHGWDEDYNKTTTVTERDLTEGESV